MTDPTATADPPRWRLEPFNADVDSAALNLGDGDVCRETNDLGPVELPPLDLEVDTDG